MYHPSATPFSGLLQEAQDHTAFQPNILWFPPTAVFISSRIIFPFIFNNFPLTSCIPDDLGKPYSTPWQIPTAMDEFANLPGSLFPLPYPSYLPEFKLTALLSEAGTALHTLLWCSPEMQLQESKPGGTSTTVPLAFGTEKVQKKIKIRSIGQRDTDPTSRHYSSGMGSIFATEGDFPKPCCVLRSAVRLTRRDYCHLHHNHVVGLVLRTKTSTHSREKGGGRRGEGAREHTKEPMQTNNQSPPHLW